jgi:hypothetical protein
MSVTERFGYWERGAAVLRSFGYPHEYGCPLCLRLFRRDQIDQLSLDHVPPKSVGSKLKVLTCKTCNSVALTVAGGWLSGPFGKDLRYSFVMKFSRNFMKPSYSALFCLVNAFYFAIPH